MQIKCGRRHIRLTEHYMHLAAVVRLVVKEMQHGDRRCIHAILRLGCWCSASAW